jgi:hypothetical protein
MNPLKYFDLNRCSSQTSRQQPRPKSAKPPWGTLRGIERPPDRRAPLLTSCWKALTQAEPEQLSILEQVMMYCGVLLGVYFSGMIRGQDFRPTLLLAAILALLIVPIAFEKLRINPGSPLLVRFGLFVQNGVFWDVMLQAIGGVHR